MASNESYYVEDGRHGQRTHTQRCKHDVKDGCDDCYREVDRLVDEGMQPGLARDAVFGGEGEWW